MTLVSNCPDDNPDCVLPQFVLPYPKQRVSSEGNPLPGIDIDVVVVNHVGKPVAIDPERVSIVFRLMDPDDRSLYDDIDLNDNLERLDTAGDLLAMAVQENQGGSVVELSPQFVGERKYWAAKPELINENLQASISLLPLSQHPGDNYEIEGFLKSVERWDSDAQGRLLPIFSVPIEVEPFFAYRDRSAQFEIWDRLFIEDDYSYRFGMLLKEDLPVGSNQATLLAFDFDENQESEALSELGCNEMQAPNRCCDSIGPTGECTPPGVKLFSSAHRTPVDAVIETAACSWLSEPDRNLHECVVTLSNPDQSPFSLPHPLLVANVAALVRGTLLEMRDNHPEDNARTFIEKNMNLLFHEVVFLSDYVDPNETILPKVPKVCDQAPTEFSFFDRASLLRPFFDNNQGGDIPADVDNVVHLITTTDFFLSACTSWGPALGHGVHWHNNSFVYADYIETQPGSEIHKSDTWIHEIIHQFDINHCDQGDHCVEIGTLIDWPTTLGGACLMHGNPYFESVGFLGTECAIPTSPNNTPRNISDDTCQGTGKQNYMRYNNRLNVLP